MRQEQGLSALPKVPGRRHWIWLPTKFVERHWGSAGTDTPKGALLIWACSHTLHRGQAASSRTGRIAHSVSALPRRQTQSDLLRGFPWRLGQLWKTPIVWAVREKSHCNRNRGRNGLSSSLDTSSRGMSASGRSESPFAAVLRSDICVQATHGVCRPAPFAFPWHGLAYGNSI